MEWDIPLPSGAAIRLRASMRRRRNRRSKRAFWFTGYFKMKAAATAKFERNVMEKSIGKRHSPRVQPGESDGYYLFIAVITIFLISTLAILAGLGLALIA